MRHGKVWPRPRVKHSAGVIANARYQRFLKSLVMRWVVPRREMIVIDEWGSLSEDVWLRDTG